MAKKSKVLFEVSENGSIASPSNKLNNKKNKKNQKLLFEVGEDGRTTNFDLSKQGTGNTQNKQYVGGLFKGSSLFDDGYQFGDVTKTIGSSAGDLATDLGEGFLSKAETVADWAQYRMSDLLGFIGDKVGNESIKSEYKRFSEMFKKNAEFNSTASLLGKSESPGNDLFKTGWADSFEENSVLGDTLDVVNQNIGGVAALAGTAYLGAEMLGAGASSMGVANTAANMKKIGVASSILSSYTSAYGDARSNAYANGADDKSAHKAGVINGIAEAISEQIFEGIPGLKVEGWGSKTLGKLAGKIEKSFGTKTGKIFMKVMDATGEGAEEIISNLLTTTGDYIANIGGNYEYGMQGKTGNYIKDIVNDLTSEDSWKAFFTGAMTSAIIGGSKTVLDNTQKNIILKEYAKDNGITYKEAKTKFENTVKAKNDINLPFNERIEAEENISKQELQNMRNGTFVAQETPNLPISKENQKFNFDSSKVTDEFEKSVYESATKSLNNTEETHQFVDKVAQIAKDKKSNYGFINNEELKTSGYNIDGKEIGGLVVTNENGQKQILINIDSPKALNSIVGHETTHLLEGTKEYQELQQSIFEYAKEKGDFDTRQQALTELYKDIKNADINSEMTADLVGDYLFTDEKFINSLSTKKPSLFQRIKDLIDDLVVRFKGTKEEKLLREVQKKFKAAYQQEGNIEGNKYMMIGKNGAKTGIQTNQRYNDIKDRYFEAIRMENKNSTNEEIRQKTGWFKDNKGNWEFEISDRNTKLKIKPDANKTYKMSELFDASTLYDLYPEIKDIKVEFKKMKKSGNYSNETRTININNNNISDLDSVRGTLLHEIQHYIQRKEGFPPGTTLLFGNEHYANSKGEIEAADVKRRRNLTVEQRKNIIPESAKENPIHPNREAILNHKRNLVEKITEWLYNKYGDKIDGVDQENFLEDIRKTSESMVEAYLEDGGLDEKTIQKNIRKNTDGLLNLDRGVSTNDSKFSHETKEKQIQNSKENSDKAFRQTDNNDRVKGIYDYEQNKHINNKDFYEELDDSSFNLPLSEQLERQGTKILEEAELKRQGMIDNFKEYLEEHNITHPTQEDIDNSITDIMSYDNEQSSADNARDEKLYNQYVREYMEENNIPFKENNNIQYSLSQDYRGSHQIKDAESITKLNLQDIQNKVEEANGYLSRQDQSDLAKLKRILNNPSDNVKIYRASPVNELNSGDWVTTDKSYAQNVASQNGGKVYTYEVAAEQLYYPNDVKELPSLHRLSSFQYVEQSNNNAQYSLSHDNQGRELSKQQQEYFKNSKIRDENGNLMVMYHGTPNGDFTIFNPGSYFSPNSNYANNYQDENASILKQNKGTTNKKTYATYLNIKNPFELNNKEARDIYINEFIKGGYSGYFDPYTSYNDYIKQFSNNDGFEWLEAEELKEWIQENHPEYDGLIVQEVPDNVNPDAINLAYIPFNSNQIKNVDNTNPTIDDDIRYSLSNNDVKGYGDYNVYGEDVKYQEQSETNIPSEEVNLPTNDTINTNEINLPIAEKQTIAQTKTQEAASKLIKDKIKKAIDKESYKAVNTATKVGNSYLDFDRQQKRDFKEHLSDYIGKSREELINPKTFNDIKDLVRQYADKEITYVDSEMEAVKKDIKNFKIKVTDELKNQITDYNDFRKSNFGKLQLGNSGTNIDSVYEELSSMYPHYFGEATTEADMLYELSEFMNHDTTEIERFRLSEEDIEQATTKVYNSLIQNTLNKDDIDGIKEKIEKKYSVRKREVIQQELLDEMGITKEDIARGKDISSIDIARTDPIRLNEKIFGYETGRKINDATINKTKHNEAERTRWLNKERQEIKELGIKARSKESAAVQKYGEKQYIDENGDVRYYGDAELAKEFNDINTQEKIREAAKILRSKYDTYIEQINRTLTDMGYKPIQKRDDYMRHFQALNDVFSRYGVPLNKESMQSDSLPTDINGLTDQFKPGKQYFASALQRIGMKTEYDAITGIDGYLEGASNLIYHTEDIQRYRTLSKLIRETYGTTHGFDDFANMTEEEQQERIEDIRSNKLAKYASWLDEQANALANKKGKIDRGAEEVLGRKIYNVLDTAKKQVGSNMTGFNVRSALTNFASVIQGASKTNKLAFIKGTVSTINNIIHKDNLIDKSDFLTSRFGSDSLSPKLWQKISNAGQIFMEGTDWFTSNQIWRSKYFENLQKGMNENAAIKDADDFSARIMGDRSKGATATLFNSKTLGFFTQFQLEVNNQWSSLIHDNKMDIESGKKTGATVVFQLGQLFGLSYLFNGFMKVVTGRDVMLDPIEMLKKIFAPDDDKDLTQKAEEVLGNLVDNLPFSQLLSKATGLGSGGRIPVSEALDVFPALFGTAFEIQKDQYGNKMTRKESFEDLKDSISYWLLPTGYGQIKKTKQGLKMYDKNLPIAGSYTDSGKLRFEADTSILGKLQAAAFGQYASKNAREYFDKGYSPLTEKQLNTALDAGLNVDEYRNYNSKIKEKENNDEKIDYIYNLPIKDGQKNVLANSVLNRKEDVDISNYGDYGSLAEFDYANKNPEKYQTITQITDFNSYNNYKDEIASIKEKYTDTNERKSAVFNYINSLKMNKHQKLMLYKLAGGYSIKNYKNEMINYINSLKLTAEEKHTIYDELFK